ncbi:MAG: protein kinase [Rhodothermales bacterium]
MHIEESEIQPPYVIGNWRLVELLGRGGQAEAFRAESSDGNSNFVLKLARPWSPDGKASSETQQRLRFESEIRIVKELVHAGCPRIGQILADGVVDVAGAELPYYVMPLFGGRDLGDPERLERLRGNVDVCLEICYRLAETLEFIHGLGHVHRDVHPGNVLFSTINSDEPFLVDFGLAYSRDDSRGIITSKGEAIGAWQFRPEEFSSVGRDAYKGSEKGDVHMLGMVLYWILSGGDYVDVVRLQSGEWGHESESKHLGQYTDDPRIAVLNKALQFVFIAAEQRIDAHSLKVIIGQIIEMSVPEHSKPEEVRIESVKEVENALAEFRARNAVYKARETEAQALREAHDRFYGVDRMVNTADQGGLSYSFHVGKGDGLADFSESVSNKGSIPDVGSSPDSLVFKASLTVTAIEERSLVGSMNSYYWLWLRPDGQETLFVFRRENENRPKSFICDVLSETVRNSPETVELLQADVRGEMGRLTSIYAQYLRSIA